MDWTMLARVFTLRFDAVQGGFDDTPLREFLVDKDVLAIRVECNQSSTRSPDTR